MAKFVIIPAMSTSRGRFLSVLVTWLLVFFGASDRNIRGDENVHGRSCHLFILSGQSNMAGLNPDLSFTPAVVHAFGKDEILVVKDALGGQPIRRWIPNWTDAKGENYPQTGDLYERLMKKVKKSVGNKSLKSVSLVWMQGERDAREKHGEVYGQSLKKLVDQIAIDTKIQVVNVIVGRLSDFDMKNERYPHWTKVRKAQVEFAKKYENVSWIDTDDLNGEMNDLHYTKEGYTELGELFAKSAIKHIKNSE